MLMMTFKTRVYRYMMEIFLIKLQALNKSMIQRDLYKVSQFYFIKRNYLYTLNPNFYKIRYKALDSPCTVYT